MIDDEPSILKSHSFDIALIDQSMPHTSTGSTSDKPGLLEVASAAGECQVITVLAHSRDL